MEIIGSVNFISLMWHFYAFFILGFGIPMLCFPNIFPTFLKNIYNYGKLMDDKNVSTSYIDTVLTVLRIPKWTFIHFYVIATVYQVLVSGIIVWSYFVSRRSPTFVIVMLDAIAGQDRTAVVEPLAVIIVTALFLGHVIRRLYECKWVSVFSNGSMSLPHYIVGVTFYLGVSNSLIALAPGFTVKGLLPTNIFDYYHWKWCYVFGTVFFIWASWNQYKCTVILANLRKDPSGKVLTVKHKIPHGYWFEYVCCPHMLAEIFIYLAINIILGFRNSLLVSMLTFVIVNQTMVAIMNRRWYLDKFKEFPKQRKAILPFLL